MVSLKRVQQSNGHIGTLPQGLVALFIGATSGIGQSTLQHFAQNAVAPRIYTVARLASVASHESLLASLRQVNPGATYNVITADVSLVSEVDKVVHAITQRETKLDILVMSTGFMAFEGRKYTREGLEPSMTTRYFSRLRAVQQLLPLLNNPSATSPRILSVQAGGLEQPLNEADLYAGNPSDWSFWKASVQATTMGTLSLERFARENPRLSIVHWFPGPVATPGLAKARKFGMSASGATSQEEAGERGLFLTTSDRYAVKEGGLVSVPDGLEVAKMSGGGIFLVDPRCDSSDNEQVLADMRKRDVDERVWRFTQRVFDDCTTKAQSYKEEL